jgi:hypothetical protein
MLRKACGGSCDRSQNLASRRAGSPDPTGLRRLCDTTMPRLTALPVGTPSSRLLADKAAEVLAGMAHALNGLALLVADPARPVPHSRGVVRLGVPDWLPALVDAGRTLVVIGAVTLFWIVSVWPNGTGAITFAAIVVILLAPQADRVYAAAMFLTVRAILDVVLTASIAFAVLPGLGTETFVGFSPVIAACLVAIGRCLGACAETLADDVHRNDVAVRTAPRTGESHELRHPAVL